MLNETCIRWSAEEHAFVATSDDLPMRSVAAATPIEALSELLSEFPHEPGSQSTTPSHSAVLRVRAPRSFSRLVRRAAEQDGVPCETLVLSALTRALKERR